MSDSDIEVHVVEDIGNVEVKSSDVDVDSGTSRRALPKLCSDFDEYEAGKQKLQRTSHAHSQSPESYMKRLVESW